MIIELFYACTGSEFQSPAASPLRTRFGEGGVADEIAAALPGALLAGGHVRYPLEYWPPSLWPNHGPAGIGNRRRPFVPILRPWRQRRRLRDSVDQNVVDVLVEEAQIAFDLGAFRDRIGVGPHQIAEQLVVDLDRVVARLALVGATGDFVAREQKAALQLIDQ